VPVLLRSTRGAEAAVDFGELCRWIWERRIAGRTENLRFGEGGRK